MQIMLKYQIPSPTNQKFLELYFPLTKPISADNKAHKPNIEDLLRNFRANNGQITHILSKLQLRCWILQRFPINSPYFLSSWWISALFFSFVFNWFILFGWSVFSFRSICAIIFGWWCFIGWLFLCGADYWQLSFYVCTQFISEISISQGICALPDLSNEIN